MGDWTLDDFTVLDDGWWEGPDGVQYGENALMALHAGVLGFCGCGFPEGALRHIRSGLELVSRKQAGGESWSEFHATLKQDKDDPLGSRGAAYFFWYWCDREGLTDHGGSVPGWLTLKGEKLLEDLRAVLPADDPAQAQEDGDDG